MWSVAFCKYFHTVKLDATQLCVFGTEEEESRYSRWKTRATAMETAPNLRSGGFQSLADLRASLGHSVTPASQSGIIERHVIHDLAKPLPPLAIGS